MGNIARHHGLFVADLCKHSAKRLNGHLLKIEEEEATCSFLGQSSPSSLKAQLVRPVLKLLRCVCIARVAMATHYCLASGGEDLFERGIETALA